MLNNCDATTHPWPAADLCIADPPWAYERRVGASAAEDHYSSMPMSSVVALLERMPATRLALWLTWPKLGEWSAATVGWRWGQPKTGGAWVKSREDNTGHYGQGYHWAGCSELVLIYTRNGSYTDRAQPLRNAWVERPGNHSAKPIEWQAQMIRRWVPPGGAVIDPFAGLGSVAIATMMAGERRNYIGTELDPERYRLAVSNIDLHQRRNHAKASNTR